MRRAIRGDFGGERAQNLKLVFILSLLGAQVLLGRSMPGGLGWRQVNRTVVHEKILRASSQNTNDKDLAYF